MFLCLRLGCHRISLHFSSPDLWRRIRPPNLRHAAGGGKSWVSSATRTIFLGANRSISPLSTKKRANCCLFPSSRSPMALSSSHASLLTDPPLPRSLSSPNLKSPLLEKYFYLLNLSRFPSIYLPSPYSFHSKSPSRSKFLSTITGL